MSKQVERNLNQRNRTVLRSYKDLVYNYNSFLCSWENLGIFIKGAKLDTCFTKLWQRTSAHRDFRSKTEKSASGVKV